MNAPRRFRVASFFAVALALAAFTASALADDVAPDSSSYAPPENPRAQSQPIRIGFFRSHDARGLNVFEAPKRENVEYHGFEVQWGAAFTQQFQHLGHSNTADSIRTSATEIGRAHV